MRTFVLGDVHGNFRGLEQVFERSGFVQGTDHLITLGDIVDGHTDAFECVEFLKKIPNRIDIMGNHDVWMRDWLEHGILSFDWQYNGGKYTVEQYKDRTPEELGSQLKFFKGQHRFYVDDQNRVFVHAGYTSPKGIGHEAEDSIYYWDRSLWKKSMTLIGEDSELKLKITCVHKEVFIGHTTTQMWSIVEPMNRGNVWNIDTGAGYTGKLTLMNVDTHEYFQSDYASDLGYVFKR